jgi:uncharacterized protein (DUF169 family)
MSEQLQELLGLETPPIAVTFHDTPPDDVPRVEKVEASGCTYWSRAAEGKTFYTEASDHYNCPIGCFTHNVELPDAQIEELESTLNYMYQLGYLTLDDVQSIPTRENSFQNAVYEPLTDMMDTPDVVIVSGKPRQLMLLAEAAIAAEVEIENGAMGRPTCAIVPAVIQSGKGASSLGCIGNRVYTALSDDDFYFAFPGEHIHTIVDKLWMIVNANDNLESYHKERQAEI